MAGLFQRLLWRLPDDFSPSWTYDASVDVLIVGGGVQGLSHLSTLREAGYDAALLVHGDPGRGPMAHWNGVFDRGYDEPNQARSQTIDEEWLPWLEENDVTHESDWYAITSSRATERLRDSWTAHGYPFEATDREALPTEWHEGELFDSSQSNEVSAIEQPLVSKRDLLSTFLTAHGNRILKGSIEAVDHGEAGEGTRIESVRVDLETTGAARVEPETVVVASGGDAGSLVTTLGTTGERQSDETATPDDDSVFEGVNRRTEHVLAVRAPRGALPTTPTSLLPRDVTVATHVDDRGHGVGRVTWLVTSQSFEGTESDETHEPGRIDPDKVGTGFAELFSLVPAVRERAERENTGFEFGVFSGVGLDFEDATHRVTRVDGIENVLLSLSEPTTCQRAAATVRDELDGAPSPSDGDSWLPTDLTAADVANPLDDTKWLDYEELIVRYPDAKPLSYESTSGNA